MSNLGDVGTCRIKISWVFVCLGLKIEGWDCLLGICLSELGGKELIAKIDNRWLEW